MITPKPYQDRVLESLRDFFRIAAREQNPEPAFREITQRVFGAATPYIPVSVAGMQPQMPYVCLRVPTGGGKTLLACHAAGLAMTDFMRAERAVVLWLVPSHTILDQTADALRDPRHPYRRALELACGAVEVVTIEEALRLSRATVDGQTVVIVSTIQAFRVEDTTGRKVYGQNGSFSEHLLNVPADRLADLLPGADGKPKPSLVNMLRLRRPIVIVDEAHNARTDLSFTTLGNVLPSCIVEFTATPARFGDPEAQVYLTRLENDLLELLFASADGTLDRHELQWKPEASVCVIMASGGYPGNYQKGKVITGLDTANNLPRTKVFHAGTALQDGQIVTSGGRVLSVTALGKDLKTAQAAAYAAVDKIHFEGAHFRRDIAAKAMK